MMGIDWISAHSYRNNISWVSEIIIKMVAAQALITFYFKVVLHPSFECQHAY